MRERRLHRLNHVENEILNYEKQKLHLDALDWPNHSIDDNVEGFAIELDLVK